MKSNIIAYNKRKKKWRVKETLHSETQKTIKSLIITLTSMIIVLLVVSFVVSNGNAQRGYTLQQEKLKNEDLKNTNESITTKITQTTSFTNIKDSEIIESMDLNEDTTYVTTEDNSIN